MKQLLIHAGEQACDSIQHTSSTFRRVLVKDFFSENARRTLILLQTRPRRNAIPISVSFFVAPGDMLLEDLRPKIKSSLIDSRSNMSGKTIKFAQDWKLWQFHDVLMMLSLSQRSISKLIYDPCRNRFSVRHRRYCPWHHHHLVFIPIPSFCVCQTLNAANSRRGVTRPIWGKLCLHHKEMFCGASSGAMYQISASFFHVTECFQFFKDHQNILGDSPSCCFNSERSQHQIAIKILSITIAGGRSRSWEIFPGEKTSPSSGFKSSFFYSSHRTLWHKHLRVKNQKRSADNSSRAE